VSRKDVDRRLIPIGTAKMLVEYVSRNTVEIREQTAFANLRSLGKFARNTVDSIVGQIERWNAASAFEVLDDPAANILVLLSGEIHVLIKRRQELVEGLLIEIPFAYLKIPLPAATDTDGWLGAYPLPVSPMDSLPLPLQSKARPVVGHLPPILFPHFNLSISQSSCRTQAVAKHLCVEPLHQLGSCHVVDLP